VFNHEDAMAKCEQEAVELARQLVEDNEQLDRDKAYRQQSIEENVRYWLLFSIFIQTVLSHSYSTTNWYKHGKTRREFALARKVPMLLTS
jgi:hypothetical protein